MQRKKVQSPLYNSSHMGEDDGITGENLFCKHMVLYKLWCYVRKERRSMLRVLLPRFTPAPLGRWGTVGTDHATVMRSLDLANTDSCYQNNRVCYHMFSSLLLPDHHGPSESGNNSLKIPSVAPSRRSTTNPQYTQRLDTCMEER